MAPTALDIVLWPDDRLTTPCDQVCYPLDADTKDFVEDLCSTLKGTGGAGLAAPQVGKNIRIVAISGEVEGNPFSEVLVLCNPRIVERGSKTVVNVEGCLSLPNLYEGVIRPIQIVVEAENVEGNTLRVEAEDSLFCTCLQHEIDHLDGIMFFDRISRHHRRKMFKEHRRLLRKAARENR